MHCIKQVHTTHLAFLNVYGDNSIPSLYLQYLPSRTTSTSSHPFTPFHPPFSLKVA
jgi:hypothetical protein